MTDIVQGSQLDTRLRWHGPQPANTPPVRAQRTVKPLTQARSNLWSWMFKRQQATKQPRPTTLICGPRTRDAQARARDVSA